MLAPDKGNLAGVYREFWKIHDIAQQVEPSMNAAVRTTAMMEAEITEGTSADWYLVTTFPGDDLKAMRHLARRRFGIFRPMQQRTWKRNEMVRLQGWEPVFPGWLFVYVWDMPKLHNRIRACPGVMGLLSNAVTLLPVAIDDRFIRDLHDLSWVYDDRAAHAHSRAAFNGVRHRKRRPRPGNRIRKAPDAIAARLCKAEWATANKLAPEQRIVLLKRTLLPPVEV